MGVSITSYSWGGCDHTIVWSNKAKRDAMVARCERVAPMVKRWTLPLSDAPAGQVRDGWEQNAKDMGACSATGLGAFTG